jgi:phosphohistidine phosphatase SixA
MQQLLILRHAKAVPWSPAAEDFPRKLTHAGREHAQKVATWMDENLDPPETILCSPSQRTRETLTPILASRPELESVVHFVPQLYHATSSTIESLLDSAFAKANRVLIVGHNPGFESLAAEVIHPRHHQHFVQLPTGTLVVVEFSEGWAAGHDRGILRHIVRGKEL